MKSLHADTMPTLLLEASAPLTTETGLTNTERMSKRGIERSTVGMTVWFGELLDPR
jgi:hypothetical protein